MNLHNTPTPALVDELGSLSELAKDAKARIEILRAEVIARGLHFAEGETYNVTITKSERATLDTKKIRDEMSPEWVASHTNTSQVTTVKTNRIPKATVIKEVA